MSKRSRSLNIGGHLYAVIEQPLVHKEENKELYGQHAVKHNIIRLNEEVTHSRKVETLVHEVLHAIYFNTGLEHNERQIEAISNGLHQLGVGDFLWKKSTKK
tara:strand:+ start:719 stop:1024 length:306 start_codon:yes stop_codon:yes gene_type:complete